MGVEKTCDQVVKAVSCRIIRQHSGKTGTPKRAVAVTGKVWKAIHGSSQQAQAQLLRTFEQWCAGYPLPDGKHKQNEGRAKNGGKTVMRQAFAAPGVRLYGWTEKLCEVEVFFLVDCDMNKKQQSANQELLAEVGRKIFVLKNQLERELDDRG